MAANIVKSSDSGLAEMPQKFYNRTILSRILPNIIWPMFGQPRPMPANAGQTINFRGFDSLPSATTPLTEGVTPDGETLTMSKIEATPKQYGTYVKLTDVVDLTSFDPVLTETAELLGEQAAETYDLLVRDVVCAGTNVQYANSRTTRGTVAATDKLTTAEILKAVRTFHINRIKKMTGILNASTGVGTVPIAAGYVAVIGAKTLYDLKTETSGGFVPVHKYANTTQLLPNEVGSIDEVRFVLTDHPKVFAGEGAASADVHATVIFGRDAFGIVQLQGVQNIVKGFGSGDDPLNQRMTSGWKAYFTSVILQQLAILRIEHGVTA